MLAPFAARSAQRRACGADLPHPELLQHPQRGGVVVEALGGDPAYTRAGEGVPGQRSRSLYGEPQPAVGRDDAVADLDRSRRVRGTVKPGLPDERLVRRVDDEAGEPGPGPSGDARQHPGEICPRPRLRNARAEYPPQLRPVLEGSAGELRRQRHQRQAFGAEDVNGDQGFRLLGRWIPEIPPRPTWGQSVACSAPGEGS